MLGGRVCRRTSSAANIIVRSATVVEVAQTGHEGAVDRRPVLRIGHTGPVHRQRAVHHGTRWDEAGLCEPGNRTWPVLQQKIDYDHDHDRGAAVRDGPLGRVRGRDRRADQRPDVRVRGTTTRVGQET